MARHAHPMQTGFAIKWNDEWVDRDTYLLGWIGANERAMERASVHA
jgi:hypothetical protein